MKEQTNRPKRLYRSRESKVLAGVCGGIAEYFGIDPVVVRLLWVLLVLIAGTGILAYLIAWLIIPSRR
jgi:phage shock protein C